MSVKCTLHVPHGHARDSHRTQSAANRSCEGRPLDVFDASLGHSRPGGGCPWYVIVVTGFQKPPLMNELNNSETLS